MEVGLNDVGRVMVPRMKEWEMIYEKLEEIYEDILAVGLNQRYINRFEKLLEQCTAQNSYAAIKATNMLNSDFYKQIKTIMRENQYWSPKFIEIEQDMKVIALELV